MRDSNGSSQRKYPEEKTSKKSLALELSELWKPQESVSGISTWLSKTLGWKINLALHPKKPSYLYQVWAHHRWLEASNELQSSAMLRTLAWKEYKIDGEEVAVFVWSNLSQNNSRYSWHQSSIQMRSHTIRRPRAAHSKWLQISLFQLKLCTVRADQKDRHLYRQAPAMENLNKAWESTVPHLASPLPALNLTINCLVRPADSAQNMYTNEA